MILKAASQKVTQLGTASNSVARSSTAKWSASLSQQGGRVLANEFAQTQKFHCGQTLLRSFWLSHVSPSTSQLTMTALRTSSSLMGTQPQRSFAKKNDDDDDAGGPRTRTDLEIFEE